LGQRNWKEKLKRVNEIKKVPKPIIFGTDDQEPTFPLLKNT
jgi:hypothetical protein